MKKQVTYILLFFFALLFFFSSACRAKDVNNTSHKLYSPNDTVHMIANVTLCQNFDPYTLTDCLEKYASNALQLLNVLPDDLLKIRNIQIARAIVLNNLVICAKTKNEPAKAITYYQMAL